MAHDKWAEAQIAVLIDCGVDPADAQATVSRILSQLPDGADPATWIPPVRDATITGADVADARADWYASDAIPPKFKRLLDARKDERNG